jgi:hypothetical protein
MICGGSITWCKRMASQVSSPAHTIINERSSHSSGCSAALPVARTRPSLGFVFDYRLMLHQTCSKFVSQETNSTVGRIPQNRVASILDIGDHRSAGRLLQRSALSSDSRSAVVTIQGRAIVKNAREVQDEKLGLRDLGAASRLTRGDTPPPFNHICPICYSGA